MPWLQIVDDRDGPCVESCRNTILNHWRKKYGRPPQGVYLCHTCDNGRCRNLGHIWLGTQKENIHDCFTKNRHPWTMITREVAEAIVTRVRETRTGKGKYGTLTYAEIGKAFGISAGTVKIIMNNKHYTGVSK